MGMKVTYENLTLKQKAFICNGCGGKGGWIKPPAIAIFDKPCGEHDFDYWLGCTDEDRKKADESFYKRMKKAVKNKAFCYYIWAYGYYIAVRVFGKKHFNTSLKQKTWEDLKREMKR